jgi:hypothetical protein
LNTPTSVHADLHLLRLEHIGEGRGRKLRSLVGIKNFRSAEATKRLAEGLDTKVGIQGILRFKKLVSYRRNRP